MKKVIIVINNLETGGIQSSLLNLIKETHSKCKLTLLTFCGNEDFEMRVPANVEIIKVDSSLRQLGLSMIHLKGRPLLRLERMLYVALTKLFGRSFVIRMMCIGQKKYGDYDIAISYIHEGPQKNLYGGCNEFVLRMIRARKKIGWLHCDFALSGANNKQSKRIYQKFDSIIACSEGCRMSFVKCLPEFAHKTTSMHNCNDYNQIKDLAGNTNIYDKSSFNIVTVARLSKEKGIERALEAVRICAEHDTNINYHIVGSGDQESFLKDKVYELNMENYVKFYGNQTNPYPYIKNADLFLLTSYHEAAPVVFDEAACLGVPVFTTKTTSTSEMISECNHGFVCQNNQNDINTKLLEVVLNKNKVIAIKKVLAHTSFNNLDSMKKWSEIVEQELIYDKKE